VVTCGDICLAARAPWSAAEICGLFAPASAKSWDKGVGVLAAGVCPKAPPGVQMWSDQVLAWVKWGVLAILAERLGAKAVMAIDHDSWSISNALENMMENRAERVIVEKMETLPDKSSFDVILANINKHVIIKELPAMRQQLRKGGVILLSGLLHEDLFDIENESFKNDLPISERLNEGNWICLKLTKEGN